MDAVTLDTSLDRVQYIKHFLERHPQLASVDLMLSDINGVTRGKRISTSSLLKVAQEGMYLPASVFALDICGETVEATGLGFDQGDSDRFCQLVVESLTIIPWKQDAAQAIISMYELDGRPFYADPRHLLSSVLDKFTAKGLTPCVAIEWEFYLLDPKKDMPLPPLQPKTAKRLEQTQVYSLDELDEFEAFISDLVATCKVQNIPTDNVIAEYAPGQFEVTLCHQADALLACDQAILLKRAIKAVAKQHGFKASFMAKPYAEHAGNGCHVHVSLLDEQFKNFFSYDQKTLEKAIAGLIDTMPELIALLAPNANSYRRFQPDMFVPTQANWGIDNRTVALRIPSGSKANTRIEHRLGGADCNPYIAMSGILQGILHGLETPLTCPDPIVGDANLLADDLLPNQWSMALETFKEKGQLWQQLGDKFSHVYYQNKASEHRSFEAHISPLEHQWYQHLV